MRNILYGVLATSIAAALAPAATAAEQPYEYADDTWISIDGEVTTVTTDAFTLDYGQGLITVEMDDGDRDADGYKLADGDKVTVVGRVDDDLFDAHTIDASSVYVENLGTTFYSSAADEEDWFVTIDPVVVSETTVQGTISEVNRDDEQFTVAVGPTRVTVDVEDMNYNPLDDEGYQRLEKGDRVSVTGDIGSELFEGRVLNADIITTLKDRSESTT